MIATPLEELEGRAQACAARLRAEGIPAEVRPTRSTIGGGSLPGETLPSAALVLRPPDPEALMAALRQADPPIIARVQEDAVWLDLRTVRPDQEDALLRGIRQAWSRIGAQVGIVSFPTIVRMFPHFLQEGLSPRPFVFFGSGR
jgi:L-seryl-tRNA(Ser) seleniumtransferase